MNFHERHLKLLTNAYARFNTFALIYHHAIQTGGVIFDSRIHNLVRLTELAWSEMRELSKHLGDVNKIINLSAAIHSYESIIISHISMLADSSNANCVGSVLFQAFQRYAAKHEALWYWIVYDVL